MRALSSDEPTKPSIVWAIRFPPPVAVCAACRRSVAELDVPGQPALKRRENQWCGGVRGLRSVDSLASFTFRSGHPIRLHQLVVDRVDLASALQYFAILQGDTDGIHFRSLAIRQAVMSRGVGRKCLFVAARWYIVREGIASRRVERRRLDKLLRFRERHHYIRRQAQGSEKFCNPRPPGSSVRGPDQHMAIAAKAGCLEQ